MILNPTQAILNNSYRSPKILADYFINTCGLEPVSIVDGVYYFAKTCEWRSAINQMPWFLKLFINL